MAARNGCRGTHGTRWRGPFGQWGRGAERSTVGNLGGCSVQCHKGGGRRGHDERGVVVPQLQVNATDLMENLDGLRVGRDGSGVLAPGKLRRK